MRRIPLSSSSCCSLGKGIKNDAINRAPHYYSDWITDAWSPKVLSSTFFIFFTSIGPALTFSLLLATSTDDEIGVIEVLVATSITGMLFSILSGQPLVIVGVTGPISILTASIYLLSEQWGLKFLPLYAWSQIWAAIMLITLAFVNASFSIKYVTRFSCEIFGVLIALIYIYEGIIGIVHIFSDYSDVFASQLIQLIIAIGTLYLASFLSHAKSWKIMTEFTRELLSDYGATLSIVLWSFVPSMTAYRMPLNSAIPTLFIPTSFQTTSGRSWLVDMSDIPVWGVFAAIFPGLIITALFFFDHNISSLLAQEKDMKLKKPGGFDLDIFILGLGVILTGVLGLPPTNGLIPQSPLHTKSLLKKRRVFVCDDDDTSSTAIPTERFEVERVYEQRVSNFSQSLLIGVVCFQPFSTILNYIPTAVLYGLFLFLGLSSFEGNEMAYRMQLLFMDPILRNAMTHHHDSSYSFIKYVDFKYLRQFTLIQMFLCGIIFGITFTDAGVIFPILISVLILIRRYVLPRVIEESVLQVMDSPVMASTSDNNDADADNKSNDNHEQWDVDIDVKEEEEGEEYRQHDEETNDMNITQVEAEVYDYEEGKEKKED